ncbi:hypothetical protein GQ55_5G277500 [Panicum hallii var. hallii]|uniref:F-box domain-containing protein n=1 Tax=Panicum hallii var. hallii TaxID=1504633 RepID=A0A2T7DKV2_9POAL|nr:hypothetical protein GQ55_5G277500 [Panicum hallii var. hallii]
MSDLDGLAGRLQALTVGTPEEGFGSARLLEHYLFDEMPGDPDRMAEPSAGSGRTILAPARAPREEYGIDDLPRDVLLRVLSCLDARQVVQTCVLSQLWRDVRRINASVTARSRR